MSRIAEATYGNELAPYPNTPGFKEPTTSRDAAKAVQSKAMTLRQRVYVEIVGAGSVSEWSPLLRERVYAVVRAAGARGLTPDEAAEKLGKTVLAVRPRFTELAKKGRIVRTGERRRNISGLRAKAWRVT